MIRINLVAGGGQRSSAPAGRGSAHLVASLLAATFLLALIWVGWQLRSLHERAERVARETLVADGALRELAPIMEKLATLDARHADLAARAAALRAWREKQYAVARLLTRIGRSVPDGMQLSALRQQPGAIVVEGQATAVAVVSEFVADLERSEQLLPPVEIVDTQAAETGTGEAVRFTLRARLGETPRRTESGEALGDQGVLQGGGHDPVENHVDGKWAGGRAGSDGSRVAVGVPDLVDRPAAGGVGGP